MPFTTYKDTRLWRSAFEQTRRDSSVDEQKFFQTQYQLLREKASQLVACIEAEKRKRMWLEYDYKTTPNNLEALFRRIIAKAWKDFEEEDEFMEVGTVHGVDVIRGVTNFVRL
jgi:hypothetical protein